MKITDHLLKKPLQFVALTAIAGFSLCQSSMAVTLVSDNFTLSSGVNASSMSNTEATGVGTYASLVNTPVLTATTVSGFGDGQVLGLMGVTQYSSVYRAFDNGTTMKLSDLAVGNTLSMSFDIRFGAAPTSNLSFGFVNTASSSLNSILYVDADVAASGGYGSTAFMYRSGSPNMSSTGLKVGSSYYTEPTISADTNYKMTLDITKTSSGYLLAYLVDGITVGSTTASSLVLQDASISGIAYRYNQAGVTTYLDNVEVSLVPEPSTWAMIMGGMGILVFGQRLNRRRMN